MRSIAVQNQSMLQVATRLQNLRTKAYAAGDESKYDSVEYQSWKTGYTVSRTKSGIVSKTKIVQKVYFYETPKMFGEETKMVFSTLLGEM